MSDFEIQRLVGALERRGFKTEVGSHQLAFRGSLTVRGRAIPIKLAFENLEFAELPHVYVDDTTEIPREIVAHLDSKKELCVIDRNRFVSDRYQIVEQSLGLLDRAEEVLARNWTSEAEREISAEFPQHWGDSSIMLALRSDCKTAWTTTRSSGFLQIVSNEPKTGQKEQCGIVRTASTLSFT